MGEEPGGQERRNTQMAIARMILGNWHKKLGRARANDKKSAVFDTKQAFSDKKTPFWLLRTPVRWRRPQFRYDLSLPSSGVFQMIRRLLAASVILAAVLHFMDAGAAREVTAGYASLIAPGSCLVISVASFDEGELAKNS